MNINWKSFEIKNENNKQWAFEQMSYLLFCEEHNNKIGLFRYKNQTGIETEPMQVNDNWFGFSAKYYDVPIKDRVNQIKEAIEKAKNKNEHIDTIYFYTNQEISESSKTDRKKSAYELEIDDFCNSIGVSIVWRVPSHFERQLALPENQYIFDLFFNLNPTLDKLKESVFSHNHNILRAIRTEIQINDVSLKINRDDYIKEIEELVFKKNNLIISGEGGSGKTAVFKDFYQKYQFDCPICIFKATELNVNHVNDLFRFDHDFTISDFIKTYGSEDTKIFVIDSAEKLSELSNQNVLNELMYKLNDNGWLVIFTTRTSYLDDLRFHIQESYQLNCHVKEIPLITDEELIFQCNEFGIGLPNNDKFRDRLRNLFYLNEYITYNHNTESIENFSGFIELLWKKKIQNNSNQKNNIHIERGRCFTEIARQRANTNRFYISGSNLAPEALSQLKQDEILGYDEKHDGYFITHDIYEEWALNQIINIEYLNHSTIQSFFKELGDSLAMRRAFRLWLSQRLMDNDDNQIKPFINEVFASDINQFWKDELLVSVLLSDYAVEFYKSFESDIINNEFEVLKRMLFLLQIACKEVSSGFDETKPKGKGWEATIEFIYTHKVDFFDSNRKLVLPILLNWCQSNQKGETTRLSGLLAISILKETEQGERLYRSDNPETVYKIIFSACYETQKEIQEIFDIVIEYKLIEHNDPYQDFCTTILSQCYKAVQLIQLFPKSIINLCELFWVSRKEDKYRNHGTGVEKHYGLVDKHSFSYFPSSANQTPIYLLLNTSEFVSVIDFIIRFTNQAVENYSQSSLGKEDVTQVKLNLENKEHVQNHSSTLWSMYRGAGSPVTPYLLQSMHMALEKHLLDLAKHVDKKITQAILTRILANSTSTSLTSVVCSIVLAYPQNFYEIVLILFKSKELFHADSVRWVNENQTKSLYSMGFEINKLQTALYKTERLETLKDEHRKSNLEHLCLNYQFTGVTDFSEEENSNFIASIFKIIDEHKEKLESDDESGSILFSRMDRRNLKPSLSEDKKKILFTPELTEEQQQISNKAQDEYKDKFKYQNLRLWSDYLREDTEKSPDQYEKYESDPLQALQDTKELITELENGTNAFPMFDSTTPYYACAKLIIKYSDLLSDEDKQFCRDVIQASIQRVFSDNYNYQISDGLEVCAHAVPKLIELYPDEAEEWLFALIGVLFDKSSIGQYKRICDYAIETIHQENIWEKNPEVASKVMAGYIKFKPIYNQAIEVIRKSEDFDYARGVSRAELLEKLSHLMEEKSISEISSLDDIETNDLINYKIEDLETIILLLPNNTTHTKHINILQIVLPVIAEDLLKDRRETNNIHNIFELRINIFRKLSAVLLNRANINDIEPLLIPFLSNFKRNQKSEEFIEQFISVEDETNKPQNFWQVWKLLYPNIIGLYTPNSYFRHRDNLLCNYLLAWSYWRDGVKDWHSLTEENLWLYDKISLDLGYHPSVLYSIIKVLNSIGSQFEKQGIEWIFNIISTNPKIDLEEIESDTLYYMEKFIKSYTFLHRQHIKQTLRLKNKVIAILDFMVERGSVRAYMTRESIL